MLQIFSLSIKSFQITIDKRATPLANAEQEQQIFKLLTEAKQMGRVTRGINEVTKKVNKQYTKIVILAADAHPLEIILHLPDLCEDKGIQFVFVNSKQKLGKILNLQREVIAVCITQGKKTSLDDKIDTVLKLLE